jgi:two-component system sensor histidine kinase AlgZ
MFMHRLFSKHPLILFSIVGALVGSVMALFFDPTMRWALLSTSAVTGFVVGIFFQQTKQRMTVVPSNSHVRTTLKPELKPLPEPITSLFLYNTLHNIAALILFDSIRASEAVENLANFVRTITELKKSDQTFLGEEFKALDLYLTIERSRLGDRLLVTKQFTQECFEIPFPSLALFPFVDGCIRFGAELQTHPVTVLIGCHQEQDTMVLQIADLLEENDGETWEQSSRDEIFSELKKRLADFYGSTIKIAREKLQPIGERITIQIPLNNAMVGRADHAAVSKELI